MVAQHREAVIVVPHGPQEGQDAVLGVGQDEVALREALEDEVVRVRAGAEGEVDRAIGAHLRQPGEALAAEVHPELRAEGARLPSLALGVGVAAPGGGRLVVRRRVEPDPGLEQEHDLLPLPALGPPAAPRELEQERALVAEIVDVREPRPERLPPNLARRRGDVVRVELELRHRGRNERTTGVGPADATTAARRAARSGGGRESRRREHLDSAPPTTTTDEITAGRSTNGCGGL